MHWFLLRMAMLLGIGAAAGYAAANSRLELFSRSHAAPSPTVPAPDALARIAAHNAKVNAIAETTGKKPNVVFIMGDDIGWFNVGAYHQGIMSGKTPSIDKLAKEGMRFTDYTPHAPR